MRSNHLIRLSGVAVLFSLATTALHGQVAQPHSLDQVHCEADRLLNLLNRTQFDSDQSAKPIAILWTPGNREGDFSGLALSTQFPEPTRPFDFEKQLWLDLHSASSLLRDPAAARRPTVTLVRNDLASDLLAAGDRERLTVKVDPTGSPVPRAGDLLKVGNLKPGSSAATKRGLNAFPAPCGAPLSAADLHVFKVLARLVRGLQYIEGGSSSEFPRFRQRALIYRGAAAAAIPGGTRVSYRIDVYDDQFGGGGSPPDRFSTEIDIDLGFDGTLGAAVLRRLPLCTVEGQRDCSRGGGLATIDIVRPVPPGVFAPAAASLCFFPNFDGTDIAPCTPTQTSLDFAVLLAGTEWERP